MIYRWEDCEDRAEVARLLDLGHVVAGHSDTVIGLLAHTTFEGFTALNSIKSRFEKPYLVLISSREVLEAYAETPLPDWVVRIMESFWPGPLTIVVRAAAHVPCWMMSPEKTIAFRIPAHPGLLDLLAKTGPLFSTSANISGKPIPESIEQLDATIVHKVAAVMIASGQNQQKNGIPSTLIDCTEKMPKVIRAGQIQQSDIDTVVNSAL